MNIHNSMMPSESQSTRIPPCRCWCPSLPVVFFFLWPFFQRFPRFLWLVHCMHLAWWPATQQVASRHASSNVEPMHGGVANFSPLFNLFWSSVAAWSYLEVATQTTDFHALFRVRIRQHFYTKKRLRPNWKQSPTAST